MEDFPAARIVALLKENIVFADTDAVRPLQGDNKLKEALEIIHISRADIGDVIFKKGEKGDSIILVLDGELGVYTADERGDEIIVATVGKGSFVGEMAIIDESERMATVKAASRCVLGTIHTNDFWDFFAKSPFLAKNVLKGINKRVKEVSINYIDRLLIGKEEAKRFNLELERQVMEKTNQLREKDIKLLEMDRIAGIATLAAGVAHEINNPLSFVKSSINFVQKTTDKMAGAVRYWDDKPVPGSLLKDFKDHLHEINFDYAINSLNEKFDRIKKGIERIMAIVNNLKSFSRVDKEEMGHIDIRQSIEEAIEVLCSQGLEDIKFVKEFGEAPLIECSANGIHQCLLHTIQNAIDAVGEKGTIKICASYNEKEEEVVITIMDDGKGMPEDILSQAFNPFFTTKPVGSGTGVGLSITEKIMRRHGGGITLSSKEGEGTTVVLTLPRDSRVLKVNEAAKKC